MLLHTFKKQGLLILVLVFIIFIYFSNFSNFDNEAVSSKFPIVFYHEAFVDFRFSPPRLRIFTLNPCLKNKSYLLTKVEDTHLKLFGEPLESDCPWGWAPNCYYSSYVFETSLNYFTTSQLENISKVKIILEDKEVELTSKLIHSKSPKPGLTVCVQPLFYYSQFQNIILFIESWKNQGATHFIIYFHSSTKEVKMTLDYYQKLEILTIKPWPSFGRVSPNFPEINSQVYRIGHTMAANICVFEMETAIGSISDFDEIIIPTIGNPKSNLLEYSQQILNDTKIGALEFGHTRIQLNLTSDQTLYEEGSIRKPIRIDKSGPPKLVFKTSSVAIIVTHSIRKFIGNREKTIKASHGTMLHYRYNGGEVLQKTINNFAIFPNNFDVHIKNMELVIKEVFGGVTPYFNPDIILKLNECIHEITVKAKVCRSVVTYCKLRMDKLAEWEFDLTPGVFIS